MPPCYRNLELPDYTSTSSNGSKTTSHSGANELCGGESSPSTQVLSDVPQGSVLGPLLFLVYINDVANLQFSPNTDLNLFADDMLLYKYIDSTDLEDVVYLQQDNDLLSHWVSSNHPPKSIKV